jgi:prolyl oligopeptidase
MAYDPNVLSYPPTAMGPESDDYHGERIADPYRWLESTGAPQTRDWIEAQNELTQSWLAREWGGREDDRAALTALLTELTDYQKDGVPFERGGRWFQFRNAGLQNQPVLHVMDSPAAGGTVLLDPNGLSDDGTVAVSGVSLSDDGTLLAYATSSGGSDWQTWRVREVATGTDLGDLIEWAKFTGAAWRKDGSGFYYGRPDRPDEGSELLAADGLHRIYFHRLGTLQADDELIFEPAELSWIPNAEVSDDGRFLVISVTIGTATENQLHVLDLADPSAQMTVLVGDFESMGELVTTIDSTFYLITDYLAERKRVVAVELARPARQEWTEVVGEAPDTLLEVRYLGGKIVCHYLHDAHSVLRVFEIDGTPSGEIGLPGIASIGDACGGAGLTGRPESDLMHYGLTSFTESGSVWSYRLSSGEAAEVTPSAARFDPAKYRTEQVFVTSADGTPIPVFLTASKDLRPTGDVPVLLYGYGGFDIPVTPSFSVLHAAWLAGGGLLAVANLRGGGEYGKAWHDGGRLAVKQNVFDDFCASARWLVESGWSRPDRIAIIGGSNGGLLVGACLTQHPELFGACVPRVGVLDMLRFHKFTIGWAWISDYGSPDDPEQYRWVRAYSPLHNLKPGQSYPPTLVLTGDHDDRVVPGHSFKFAAALQAAQGGEGPALIRIETSAGHGAGKPTAKIIAESADILAFLGAALGLD